MAQLHNVKQAIEAYDKIKADSIIVFETHTLQELDPIVRLLRDTWDGGFLEGKGRIGKSYVKMKTDIVINMSGSVFVVEPEPLSDVTLDIQYMHVAHVEQNFWKRMRIVWRLAKRLNQYIKTGKV